MDGKSLSETFDSEINEIVEQMYSEGTEESEKFYTLLDKIRAPVSMKKQKKPTYKEQDCVDDYWYSEDYCLTYADQATYIENCAQMQY